MAVRTFLVPTAQLQRPRPTRGPKYLDTIRYFPQSMMEVNGLYIIEIDDDPAVMDQLAAQSDVVEIDTSGQPVETAVLKKVQEICSGRLAISAKETGAELIAEIRLQGKAAQTLNGYKPHERAELSERIAAQLALKQ